jgi:TATA-box binding protein (TBP) (component of TFIID and TFIIIB)
LDAEEDNIDDLDLELEEEIRKNLIDEDLAISVENVVASVTLEQKIDLLAIMNVFRNVEYRPKQFPGQVFRIKRPKTATLIFASGKMVCTRASLRGWP